MKFLILSIFFSLNSNAINLKAGTWEQSVKINAAALLMSPEVKAQVANLPKAQADMMLNMIAQQMGPKVIKECVTKEMIKDPKAFIPNQKDCKAKIVSNSESTFVAELDCEKQIKGQVKITTNDPSSYDGAFTGVNTTGEKMEITFTGKHISDTCQK